ncbi:MAG: hypothetical protein KGM24_15315, partial [Elusimicrobia bacterium]|nr:hypothetical protein [Elusimicrobiota bacterium]
MSPFLLLAAALACAAPPPSSATPADSISLTPAQADAIGRRIFQNEAGGKVEFLTYWDKNEDFPSLGIGHFIWYPAGEKGPFTESFPPLLKALAADGVSLPAWLKAARACPWPDRASFYRDFDGPRLKGLRALLARTFDAQARFCARRLEDALPRVLAAAPPAERATLRRRFFAVAAAPNGVYALVDYVNFKGEGTNPSERYDGLGWGLLQALQLMKDAPAGAPAVAAFERGADAALTRRVAHAP